MNGFNSKSSFSIGILAIGLGLISNKWVLERFIAADGYIESSLIVYSIVAVQLVLIGIGLYLVVRKPHLRLPSKKEVALVSASITFSTVLAEITLRIGFNLFGTDEQYSRYALYTDFPPKNRQWAPHHYLNYFPTPRYKKGPTYHNSLGYRSREFNLEKPQNVYRIVTIGGSSTYTIAVKDNDKTFPYQ